MSDFQPPVEMVADVARELCTFEEQGVNHWSAASDEFRALLMGKAAALLRAAFRSCQVKVQHRASYGPPRDLAHLASRSTTIWSEDSALDLLTRTAGYTDPGLQRRLVITTPPESVDPATLAPTPVGGA